MIDDRQTESISLTNRTMDRMKDRQNIDRHRIIKLTDRPNGN